MTTNDIAHSELYSDEEVELLDVVTSYCATRLNDAAMDIDSQSRWFDDILRDVAQIGLQGIMLDDAETINRERLRVAEASNEIVASYSPAVGLALNGARMHASMLATLATQQMREKWLDPILNATAFGSVGISEPDAGSDIRNIRTVARRKGDGWSLTGSKRWITLAPVADFSFILAKIESTDRDAETGLFIVERGMKGLEYGRPDDLIGYRGLPTGDINLDEVFITSEYVVAETRGLQTMMEVLNVGRIGAATLGAGVIRGCLRNVARYTHDRWVFGSKLADLPGVQLRTARMYTDLEASRGLIRSAIDAYVIGRPDETLVGLTKVFSTEAAMNAASDAVELAGAYGLTREGGFERYFRDAKVTQIFDGTPDVLLLRVGRSALRRTNW